MNKQIKYVFCKYTEKGIIKKTRILNRVEDDKELIKIYEDVMGHQFDPEVSYIKPITKIDNKIYTKKLIEQLIFDSVMNLRFDVKNKYAVADDLMDILEILESKLIIK